MTDYEEEQAIWEEKQSYEVVERMHEKRISYGVTQQRLAKLSGISKTYLSKIENHRKKAPARLLQKLNMLMELEICENPMEIIIDYVRVRIPTTDVNIVFEKLLKAQSKHFIYEELL